MFGRRPDEFHADGFADFGEMRIFREEPVARVDSVRPGDLGCAQDVGNIAVAKSRIGRPDANLFIGCTHMEARSIGFGKNRHCLNSELFAGANDSKSDLTAIGYQYFLEQRKYSGVRQGGGLGRGCRIDKEEGLAIFDWLGALGQNFRDPSVHF